MQISSGKKKPTNWLKKQIWEGLGLHLGVVWDGPERLLGALGLLLAGFGLPLDHPRFDVFQKWCLGGLQDRFWSLLDPFWKPPAMILEGLEGLWALSFAWFLTGNVATICTFFVNEFRHVLHCTPRFQPLKIHAWVPMDAVLFSKRSQLVWS